MRRLLPGLLGLLLAAPALAGPTDPATLAARIDHHVAAGWRANGVTPAPLTDDAAFLRRASLDLAGRVPSVREVRDFFADPRPDKRPRLVAALLNGPGYVSRFTGVWRREWLPQAQTNPEFIGLGPQFDQWLRGRLRDNVPYDRMVRELITAPPYAFYDGRGYSASDPPPTAFLFVNELKPENIAASTARLFLGVKIECAQCHNHPFETWTRQQFWEFASFFAGITPVERNFRRVPVEAIEIRGLTIPELNRKVTARFLDGKEPKFQEKVSSRVTLADWMTAKENPYFARNAVNRLWAHFFGVGLIDPLDEPGDQNPPSHPELLAELTAAFQASGHDLKYLIAAIVNSRTYQLSSAAPGASAADRTFARMRVRGLTPEQLFDSLALATYFREAPPSERMVNGSSPARAEFLAKFNTTERLSEVQTSILQALTLMNGRFVGEQTNADRSELLRGVLDAPFLDTRGKIEAVYLATVSRPPTADETAKLTAYVDRGGPTGDKRRALADVFWALLNSSEFGFNH